MSAGRAATTALISNDRVCHLVHCYSKKKTRPGKYRNIVLAFMSSANQEEQNNLYCLIYVFFLLSNIRYLNRTLEGTIATFGPFRQYSEKHLKVFSRALSERPKSCFFRALPDLPEIQRL